MAGLLCNATLSNLPNETWGNVFGYLMVVLSIMSTFENAIVFIVLFSNKVLHTPSNKILAALTASDLLTGIVLAPLHALQLLNDDIMNICMIEHIRRYLSAILIGSSALTLGIISYDRYLHLVYLQNYRMSNLQLYILLVLSWSIPSLVPLLRFIEDNERTYSLIVSLSGVMVFLIIVISYANLLVALKRHRRHSDNKMYHSYMQNQHRAGRTVLIIITFYILMFLPTIIAFILYATEMFSVFALSESYVIGLFLSLANSAVNPLIYTYRTPELKKFTQKLFGLRPVQSKLGPDSYICDVPTVHNFNPDRVAVIRNNMPNSSSNSNADIYCIGISYRDISR